MTRCGLYCRFHARKRDSGFTEIGTKPAVRSADKAKLKNRQGQAQEEGEAEDNLRATWAANSKLSEATSRKVTVRLK